MVPDDFKAYYLSLDTIDQQRIVSSLLGLCKTNQEIENITTKAIVCPHCGDAHIVGNGKSKKGVQRYLCRSCHKISSSTTGQVWYRMHKKEKLSAYIHCLLSGFSIRKSATEVGISKETSFSWRHKLLTSFSHVLDGEFSGIVESDETFFLYSEKGSKSLNRKPRQRGTSATKDGINDQHVAVITTIDRNGNKSLKVIKRGRISKEDVKKELDQKILPNSIFCTDGHPSYVGFAKDQPLQHKKIIASKGQKVIEKHYHLQNVNSLDSRLKKFMAQFNGVSTKYLQNYLNWFLVLEKVKTKTNKLQTIAIIALSSNQVWSMYRKLILNQLLIST